MKSFLVCFYLLITISSMAQDSLYQKKIFVRQNDTITYRILYPKNYDRTKSYPVVLFLHGAGERGSDNEKQLIHGSKLFASEKVRNEFPSIVIFPQCKNDSYWSNVKIDREKLPLALTFDYTREETKDLSMAIALTKHILKTEAVNKNRVYIAGLSMGGMGTFEAVYRYPKLFAAAAPICGGGDATHYNKKAARIPFWIFHGDSDNVVSPDYSRIMFKKIQEFSKKVKYTEYPGVMHNSWDNVFAEPEFLPWLFAHSK
jgi:predicted peptidase